MLLRQFFVFLIFLLSHFCVFAQCNPLDPAFKGYVFGSGATVNAIALQSDGKILLGGEFNSSGGRSRINIARLNTDGTVDTTFNPGTGTDEEVTSIAIQDDGKIIIAGNFSSYNGIARNSIARLNSDGSVDLTFVSPGPDLVKFSSVEKVLIDSNGKVLVGGSISYKLSGTQCIGMVRLNASGSVDNTFIPGIIPGAVFGFDLQKDGKIVVGGLSNTNSNIFRLNANGTQDVSFAGDPNLGFFHMDIIVQPDGRILLSGDLTSYKGVKRNGIARLLSNGDLDLGFNPGNGATRVSKMTLLDNGKIMAAGNFEVFDNVPSYALVRINNNGSLDKTFRAAYSLGYINDISVQEDGKILVGTNMIVYNEESKFGIVRLLDCLAPDQPINVSEVTEICYGTRAWLEVIGQGTIKWYTKVSDSIPVYEGLSYFLPETAGYKRYYVEASNSCAINPNRTIVEINVKSRPSVMAYASKSKVCSGTEVYLNARSGFPGPPAVSFEWEGGYENLKPFVPDRTQTYRVTGTGENGCTRTDEVTIEVQPKPDLTIKASDNSVCKGEKVTLTASGADTYLWSHNVVNGVAFTPSESQTYTVTGTIDGCKDTAEVEVEVKAVPVVGAKASKTEICEGEEIVLTGSGASSYVWPDGVVDGVGFKPAGSGEYTVTGFALNGCYSKASLTIEVNQVPELSVRATSTSVCLGKSVTLTASGASSYLWTDGIVNGESFVPQTSQSYTVTGLSSHGCENTESIIVEVKSLPIVKAVSSKNSICKGEAITLTGEGASLYSWSDGRVDGLSFKPASTTTYTLTGLADNGCFNTDSVKVIVNPIPEVKLEASKPAVCQGEKVTLYARGADYYSWTDLEESAASIKVIPQESTTYEIVGTSKGCSGKASIEILVNDIPEVEAVASNTEICSGETLILTGHGTETYSWSGGVKDGEPFELFESTRFEVKGFSSNNCSASDYVDIVVRPLPDVSLYVGEKSLEANQAEAQYQWIDCINGAVLADSVSQSLSPGDFKQYAVVVTNEFGCTDTSECENLLLTTGLSDNTLNELENFAYPNPTRGFINFTIDGSWRLYDARGNFLSSGVGKEADLSNLPDGLYIILINSKSIKVFKE